MNRLNKTAIQFVKYFWVALVGYAVDFGLLVFTKEVLHLHYLVAAVVGFIAGLIIVYILSNRFVFGESKIKSKSAAKAESFRAPTQRETRRLFWL